MHENSKLLEAKYFYSRMLAEFNDRTRFTYNLSAFLSSARSVLLYALEEAETKSGGQQWYDNYMAGSSVLSFFRDKRNINIHTEPVKPVQHTDVIVSETVRFSDTVSVTYTGANGKILYQSPPEIHEPELKKHDTSPVVKSRYMFADWSGREDIMTLSQMYLEELWRMVEDGVRCRLITG